MIHSFFFFKSKKRYISNVNYMLKTANDNVVSILVLPVGISFLSIGQPGTARDRTARDHIFGNKYGCVAWEGVLKITRSVSTFLLLCLCVTRTISLTLPKKKIYLVIAVLVMALVIDLGITMIWILFNSVSVKFGSKLGRCIM